MAAFPGGMARGLVLVWWVFSAGCFQPPLERDADGETGTSDTSDTAEVLDSEQDVADTAESVDDDGVEVDSTTGVDTAGPETDTTGRNACGGDGLLTPGEPGVACGPCSDGELVCDPSDAAKNRTRCEGASALNACQGCGPIEPALGTECGTCGLIACDGVGDTRCAEPEGGCEVPLRCEDLACGAQQRRCVEGEDGGDATCADCLETYVDVDGECRGAVVAPTGVTASDDLEDRVLLSWSAVTHATGYRVFRCLGSCGEAGPWVELVPVAIAQTSFPDETASAPSVPPAPAVSATGNRPVDVQVSWAAVLAPQPPTYSYRVVAVGPAGESAPSDVAMGRLADRPITGYEVSVAGGPWQPVEATVFVDAEAPPPTLVAGAVTATQGVHADKVVVSLATWSSPDGASREYRVRAKTRFGVGSIGTALGRRQAGPLTLTWERSASSAPADFAAIAGSSGPIQGARSYEDLDPTGIPPNGVVRYYRARLAASGAAEVVSEPAAGWRLPAPGVPQIQTVTTGLEDRVEVRWAPVDGALGYHVYRHGARVTPSQGVTCSSSPCVYSDLDAPAAEPWTAPSSVTATTNQTGGVTVSWILPGRPKGARQSYELSAINPAGESAKSSPVDGWRSGPALTGLEVKATVSGADTTHFVAADATSYNHAAAPLATFAPTTLAATQGDHRNHVKVTLTGGTLVQAATVAYQVRGQLSGGTTPWSTSVSGRRATGPISRAWEYASPASPTVFATLSTLVCPASNTSCNDTVASALGAKRIYRATLSAPGATPLTTNTMEGWRLAFTYVDGGGDAMCAIDTNGRLWAWGQFNGQGSLVPRIRAQGPFVACTSGGSQLSYDGVGFGCARTSLGDVFCGSLLADNPLIQRVDLGTGVKSIELREAHACAVKGSGQAVCWGLGVFGQLGHNAVTDSPTPVTVVRSSGAALTGLEEVAVGTMHSCARTSLGTVWCWGGNGSGQLGDGTQTQRQFAIQVPNMSGATQMSLGEEHSCVRLASGEVHCFGENADGQLGDDTRQRRFSPSAALLSASPDVPLTGALETAVFDDTTCVRRQEDTLCWGHDGGGELGNGGANEGSLLPVSTNLPGQPSDLTAGRWTACAIVGGGIWCWGKNEGMVGDNTTITRTSPTQVVLP